MSEAAIEQADFSLTTVARPDAVREAELLVQTARVRLDAARATRVASLMQPELNWSHLFRLADRHGLMPTLSWHLTHSCPGALPPAILAYVDNHLRNHAVRNLLLAGELHRLLRLFAQHHIQAIPFKGPSLAVLAYGNLALRQFTDLDVFLRVEDIFEARDLLAGQGYKSAVSLTPAQQTAYLRSIGQLPLVHEGHGTLVELHAMLLPAAFPFRLNFDSVARRLGTVVVAGQAVKTLSVEDLLLLLCVHATKHLWPSLGCVADVAELIRAQPGIDWQRVLAEAKRLACQRMLYLGLFLANDLLQAPLPEPVRERIVGSALVRSLAADVCQRLFTTTEHRPTGLQHARFHLRVRERWRDGAWSCLYLALAPTPADWTVVHLPRLLHFLYFPLRLVRLVLKYALRV
jgi:hypothetical protein